MMTEYNETDISNAKQNAENALLKWQVRYLLNRIPVTGVINGVRESMFSNDYINLVDGKKIEDQLRNEYISWLSSGLDISPLMDWYLFELQSWLGVYGYIIKRQQRSVSRKRKGGKNRKKAVKKLVRIHCRITHIRVNSAHQCTTELTRKLAPKVLVIETLKPKNMSRNRKLASSILDANFGRIHTQLEYKCRWYNIHLIKAPQFYASSKYCSNCGCYKKEDLKFTTREWTCPHCGFHHDRDVNAARNLRFYGLWLYGFATQQTAARYAVEACPCSECCREGSGSEPRPKDLRLQFFENEEQCRSLKQEISSTIYIEK